jgi:hypothetical protein
LLNLKGLSDWVTLEKNYVLIPAYYSSIVNFNIKIPKNYIHESRRSLGAFILKDKTFFLSDPNKGISVNTQSAIRIYNTIPKKNSNKIYK